MVGDKSHLIGDIYLAHMADSRLTSLTSDAGGGQ
jgi:hypothetical protein